MLPAATLIRSRTPRDAPLRRPHCAAAPRARSHTHGARPPAHRALMSRAETAAISHLTWVRERGSWVHSRPHGDTFSYTVAGGGAKNWPLRPGLGLPGREGTDELAARLNARQECRQQPDGRQPRAQLEHELHAVDIRELPHERSTDAAETEREAEEQPGDRAHLERHELLAVDDDRRERRRENQPDRHRQHAGPEQVR